MNTVREKAVLVGLSIGRTYGNGETSRAIVDDHLDELAQLVDTAGAEVIHRIVQNRATIDPAFFIGRGKAEELLWLAKERDIQLFVFDDDLSPVQLRNLEQLIGRKIIDRSGIILDIFASRARTSEARTQVELAQLQYMLPRLTRQWTHLSKQYGGVGTKGPGETQIETDRRAIRAKITHLRTKLRKIDRDRSVQRKGRENFPRAALVGYTNAGKSTLMYRLTGSEVLRENRLFATLDSTVRTLSLESHQRILLSDTVGFIRKLPHHLVASFKSTLDELLEADILIHVVDVSHRAFEDQMGVVEETLREIGVTDVPTIIVFNKTDRVSNQEKLMALARRYPGAVFLSAARAINIGALKERLAGILEEDIVEESLTLRHDQQHLLASIHEMGQVLDKKFDEESVTIRFRIGRKEKGRVDQMLLRSTDPQREEQDD
ncbi:MAG: GTPase HflX [Ignavibacteria bacterium]|nr:GTPase HflX [Ignavibacteria bacterium]